MSNLRDYGYLLYVSYQNKPPEVNEDNIRIAIVSEDGIVKKFNMSASSSMCDLKMEYSRHCSDRIDKLLFTYKGHQLDDDDTPELLGMKDDDVIQTTRLLDTIPNTGTGSCSIPTTSQTDSITAEVDEDAKTIESTSASSSGFLSGDSDLQSQDSVNKETVADSSQAMHVDNFSQERTT